MLSQKELLQRLVLGMLSCLVGKVEGEGNLPKEGGYIVASNHASYIDPFLIAAAVMKKRGRMVRYIGKSEVNRHFFGRIAYSLFDVIPVNRKQHPEDALKQAFLALKGGDVIGIFPEGERTNDGRIGEGKTGAVRLSHLTGAPIIPVAIMGTYDIWSRHRKFPKLRRKAHIIFGKPRFLKKLKRGERTSKRQLMRLTSGLMKSIIALSPASYMGVLKSHRIAENYEK